MSITARVDDYLNTQDILFNTVQHTHSSSSVGSAIAARIPPMNIAKAVVLEDHEGRHLMAVLPADRKINIHKLEDSLDLTLHLVTEPKLYDMFKDCEQGAVPAVGQAYNMNAIYDEELGRLKDIYLEAGDHETLIHLNREQFDKLMINTMHTNFSNEELH
ncbi:MAG: ybaK/prolyl-tRNA synthetase associated domain-containing protein [Osedax symbiont Rs2]|nr:MAG: ybaK/prolyl-tRNA synthetase associated domain-containing protein [Osedax symbiont Rs2]